MSSNTCLPKVGLAAAMLAQSLAVIQVNGLCVVGTPVGPKDYVREYVRNKCGTICKDIDQMRVCADPLIRLR
jgi:hypothetical protein